MRRLLWGLMVLLLASPTGGALAAPERQNGRVVSVTGHIQDGEHAVRVDVLLVMREGTDEEAVARDALARLGAQSAAPSDQPGGAGPRLRWRQFLDENPGNDFVLQSYNPAGAPAAGDFFAAFRDAQRPWSEVGTATFGLKFAGLGTRCPSMICGNGLDGFNDVGWHPLDAVSSHALAFTAVAYRFDTGFIVEADIALDPRFDYFTGQSPSPPPPPRTCDPGGPPPPPPPPPPPAEQPPPPPGEPPPPPPNDPAPSGPPIFDALTVMLHENGHVAGLDHSVDCRAVMFSTLAPGETRRVLGSSDVEAVSALYPLQFEPLSHEPPLPRSPSDGGGPPA